ncbi:hypothetical protein [Methylobacterium sp. PvR107]|uniref:hypothetical protein n=1 Tax=Methylobacterium sp. PvR107 TaxID=2806597 RepID=UPI001AE8E03A|nr:hypothetical protein [Methylobacterium sp. PvR107]MBP1180777.1 hypothetical protein [Methylobacterium sp. PvR107]
MAKVFTINSGFVLLCVAASAYQSPESTANNTGTIGNFYYKIDKQYDQNKCGRVSALLASRLSAHYACKNIALPRGHGKHCRSRTGPEFKLFDTLGACEQNRNSRSEQEFER